MALCRSLAEALVVVLVWSWTASFVTSQPGPSCPLISPLSAFPQFANHKAPALGPAFFQKLEQSIQSYVSSTAVPQYAVSVVIGNQTVFTSGLASTPFLIGSVSKTFTALGALLLREQGRLLLDDPVNKFLPEFSIINPYAPHNVTLRELMGHVSGMPRELCYSLFTLGVSEAECPKAENDILKLISRMQLARPPWSREPDYSNLGFALLGHAWEKATSPSMSWDEFISAYVFAPLQMTGSGLDSTNVTLAGRNSTGAPELDIGWVAPAGQLFSTAIDLANYLKFIINAEPPLISDASIREWTRSSVLFPDTEAAFALPWELLSNTITPEFFITKQGNLGNYETFLAIHTPTQIGVSALMAKDENTTGTASELVTALMADLIPAVEDLNAKAIYRHYAGFYLCSISVPSNDSSGVGLEPGSSVNVSFAPELGLFATFNISATADGIVVPYLVGEYAFLPRNTTENSFWFDNTGSCFGYFARLSLGPSVGMPNFPGSVYARAAVFDLRRQTLAIPVASVLCKRKGGKHHF